MRYIIVNEDNFIRKTDKITDYDLNRFKSLFPKVELGTVDE